MTVSVRKAVEGATFRDLEFLAALDVVFANLYFAALTADRDGGAGAPAAWRPLLEARHERGIARIQFALAGMNAHINRDLPEGIVQTFRALGGSPLTDRGRRQDFDSVNALLERVEQDVRSRLFGRHRRRHRRARPRRGRCRRHVEGAVRTGGGLDQREGDVDAA